MARNARLTVLLLALGATVAVALYRSPADDSAPASRAAQPLAPPRDATGGTTGSGAAQGQVPDLKLKELEADRPEPVPVGRNPFRLAPVEAPPPPVTTVARPPVVAGPPPVALPPPPPPVPPIPLKFIGIVNLPGGKGRLAALSDGRFVYHGREGDIVEGRYRIIRIGEESIELEHADGRGRQTIRLSGS